MDVTLLLGLLIGTYLAMWAMWQIFKAANPYDEE